MTNSGPRRVVVIGAGGHAKVVIEAIRASGGVEIAGLVDPSSTIRYLLGVPVLGGDEILPELRAQGLDAAVVALGGNALRERVGSRIENLGFTLINVVHPSALVSPSVRLGNGVVVMAHAVVGTETTIGDLAIVNTGAILDHDNRLGSGAHVAPGCALAGNVWVGARTLVGVGSAVRPGIRIGADAVVGAGSSVVTNVSDGATVAGAPAKPLRKVENS
jgi:UDP-perosamine 4-acetyltransferase